MDERDQHALVERLKAAQTALTPRLHELREMDEWKRFANAAVQEELIAKTETLRTRYHFDQPEGPTPEDVEKAARELHDVQERWKQVAEAPRAQAQALWHRYRQAADPILAKTREFFAQQSEERKGNLERKMELIARAEALADSSDWIKTADELKALQHAWQQIGPVPRQDTRLTWKRFRDACDKFFTRRNADLAERKETWSANLAKKEALCARAEELAASREWDRGAAEIRRLQAEWKTIGPVRRNKSEAIWKRFRTACDTFFERYKRRDEIELETKQADREALVAELDALAPAPPAEGAEAVTARTTSSIACDRWRRDGTKARRSSVRAPIRSAHGSSMRSNTRSPPIRIGSVAPSSTSTPADRRWKNCASRSKGSSRMRRRSPPTRRKRWPTCFEKRWRRTLSAVGRVRNHVGGQWPTKSGRRSPRGAPRPRPGQHRTRSQRTVPPRLQPLLRPVPSSRPTAVTAARRTAGDDDEIGQADCHCCHRLSKQFVSHPQALTARAGWSLERQRGKTSTPPTASATAFVGGFLVHDLPPTIV